ncbi:uncharacterized protein LOC115875197 isoform X1 [Sitophilus oryzae]|uniref:Uncharacterized protein LOC115875197 isoform X1 n=1 Tax=Sitophilus oryzae TaxID=7048 RepID=A0A6J2X612_SITOR|nr:uncharacterized protein LOC115875197 isoform X1 [Sitophilus oryzae]
MTNWARLIILSIVLGLAKANNFMRVILMAGMGLAGLWMVHTLAQDFHTIVQSGFGSGGHGFGGGGGGGGDKLYNSKWETKANVPKNRQSSGAFLDDELKVFKRSVTEAAKTKPHINWDVVIKRDPVSCARSFICQLQASREEELSREEKIILNLTKMAADDESSYAGQELREALDNGVSVTYPHDCMKMYRFCPYTKKMMMTLLRVFGG